MIFFKFITGWWPESFFELRKRLYSRWTSFVVPLFKIFSISWSTQTFSWEVIEISGEENFWTGTDRKGIWYPLTMFKIVGLLVGFSQFSKKILETTCLWKLLQLLWRKWTLDCRMFLWVYFWTENFQILFRRLNLVISYLWSLPWKRILALYHLYILLISFLVESLIERAGYLLVSIRHLLF